MLMEKYLEQSLSIAWLKKTLFHSTNKEQFYVALLCYFYLLCENEADYFKPKWHKSYLIPTLRVVFESSSRRDLSTQTGSTVSVSLIKEVR